MKRDRGLTPRIVPVTPELAKLLRPLIESADRDGSAYVFRKKNGEPYKNLGKWLPALSRIARVRHINFHNQRHAFAHRAWDNGLSSDMILQILGHEDAKTTKIYMRQITVPYEAVKYMSKKVGNKDR